MGPAFDDQRSYLLASLAFALCCAFRVPGVHYPKTPSILCQKLFLGVFCGDVLHQDISPLASEDAGVRAAPAAELV